jgi:hypothetical protein
VAGGSKSMDAGGVAMQPAAIRRASMIGHP